MKYALTGLLFVLGSLCLGGLPASADVTLREAQGTIVRAACGLDSAMLSIRQDDGSVLKIRLSPDAEPLASAEDNAELKRRTSGIPQHWPSVTDTWSRVRVWYVPRETGAGIGVGLQVVRRPSRLFGVVISSLPGEDHAAAFRAQVAAEQKGFSAGRFASRDYPRLRPGFLVVVAGVTREKADADALLRRARQAGYADSYVRQIW